MSRRIHNKRAKPKKDVIYLKKDFDKIKRFEGRYIAGFDKIEKEAKKIQIRKGNLDNTAVSVIWKITKIDRHGHFNVKSIAGKRTKDIYNSTVFANQLPKWPIISKKMAKKLIKDRNLNVYTGELF